MALKKKFLKTKPVCKVGFSVASDDLNGSKKVFLVGDFNQWDTEARPMRKQKNGSYSITMDLELGREYQFRYLTADGRWLNDPDADRYEFNEYAGTENSVVST